jgi:hypothetical protein
VREILISSKPEGQEEIWFWKKEKFTIELL